MDFVIGLLVGLLVGGTAGVSFALPTFGRSVSRFLAVVLIGLGVAMLIWPLALQASGEPLRGPFGSNVIEYRSEAFAWSGGLLIGGSLAAVGAFWRRSTPPDRG
jgi:hypothetical protein